MTDKFRKSACVKCVKCIYFQFCFTVTYILSHDIILIDLISAYTPQVPWKYEEKYFVQRPNSMLTFLCEYLSYLKWPLTSVHLWACKHNFSVCMQHWRHIELVMTIKVLWLKSVWSVCQVNSSSRHIIYKTTRSFSWNRKCRTHPKACTGIQLYSTRILGVMGCPVRGKETMDCLKKDYFISLIIG